MTHKCKKIQEDKVKGAPSSGYKMHFMEGQFHTHKSREIVLPMEGQNGCKVSVEDHASHNRIAAI